MSVFAHRICVAVGPASPALSPCACCREIVGCDGAAGKSQKAAENTVAEPPRPWRVGARLQGSAPSAAAKSGGYRILFLRLRTQNLALPKCKTKSPAVPRYTLYVVILKSQIIQKPPTVGSISSTPSTSNRARLASEQPKPTCAPSRSLLSSSALLLSTSTAGLVRQASCQSHCKPTNCVSRSRHVDDAR